MLVQDKPIEAYRTTANACKRMRRGAYMPGCVPAPCDTSIPGFLRRMPRHIRGENVTRGDAIADEEYRTTCSTTHQRPLGINLFLTQSDRARAHAPSPHAHTHARTQARTHACVSARVRIHIRLAPFSSCSRGRRSAAVGLDAKTTGD
ncbi:hypothetical protein PUN28_005693 [Cardiocondyla obscurior]|uniref:Uncharacterized protein n=1 Tax=Cardiocondyla obscurior TaxID=286306 RepID=A0AAW2G9Z7_9HYME